MRPVSSLLTRINNERNKSVRWAARGVRVVIYNIFRLPK